MARRAKAEAKAKTAAAAKARIAAAAKARAAAAAKEVTKEAKAVKTEAARHTDEEMRGKSRANRHLELARSRQQADLESAHIGIRTYAKMERLVSLIIVRIAKTGRKAIALRVSFAHTGISRNRLHMQPQRQRKRTIRRRRRRRQRS